MGLSARGRVAAMADVSAGPANGGVTAATPTSGSLQAPFGIDFGAPSTWVGVIFVGSVLYLLGAYVVLGRYRVPI